MRRSAEEARTALLDAAERRLLAVGPGGIRLTDVAAEVGVSHPTVLHHFGTREALVQAVVARAFAALDADVQKAIADAAADERGVASLLDHVAAALSGQGHARALAWLALSDFRADGPVGLEPMVRAAQAHGKALAQRLGRAAPSLDDTRFAVLLTAFALFGEAILGGTLFPKAGLDDPAQAGKRFRAWLGRLLVAHLDRA